jgi:LytS/YehU family sensor histidine kinase
MSNKTSVELFAIALYEGGYLQGDGDEIQELLDKHKEMQQEQAQLYATFVLMCVNNNLPPITFNDWVTNIRR